MAINTEMLSEAAATPTSGLQTLSGANIFLSSLVAEGVDTVFGLPGGVILPIYEELPDYPINHLLVRHEQCAVHMAEGYAKATGKAGVALVTSGPGATNTVTGLADAYYDSVPVVVFTGNVASHMLGKDAFQEADIVAITRPCTKHNILVRRVEDLAEAIREAFHVATTGRPGPVLVDMPRDVLVAKTWYDPSDRSLNLPGYQPQGKPQDLATDADLTAVLQLINQAERPVLLAGGGVIMSEASPELLAFAERFRLPVSSSLMGLGAFPADHPQYLGFCGMHGHVHSNIAIANADLLLIVGNRLGERQTGKPDRFARNATIVHIDLDPTSLQKNVEAHVPIQGDIRSLLTRMLTLSDGHQPSEASQASHLAWMATIDGWKARRSEKRTPQGDIMTPQYAIERLFAHLPADAIVTTEVGQHQMWAAQRFNLSQPRSFVTSGGLGTMGFGFPAAIGAQAAFPDRTVVDIAGDGSFQMVLQEMATARDYNLPVKVAIINNGHLGMIRQWQGKMYTRESSARLSSPDYVKLADAYGCKGFVVDRVEDLDRVLAEVMAITDSPVLIDLRVTERTDVYPWVPAGAGNDEMLTDPENREADC